jgi:hypothetical protein
VLVDIVTVVPDGWEAFGLDIVNGGRRPYSYRWRKSFFIFFTVNVIEKNIV